VADCISVADVQSMGSYPAIFAMANPDPEIRPDQVAECMGDRPFVMATGRSDYPNQVNNVLGFPFLFRGALEVNATAINTAMKIAAADALAGVARDEVPGYVQEIYSHEELAFGNGYVIPKPFDRRLLVEVSHAVASAAVRSGAAPECDLDAVRNRLAAEMADLT
jgi:malate dehydrogenase (oxaloacetate-decarboxylating)(NADP+)